MGSRNVLLAARRFKLRQRDGCTQRERHEQRNGERERERERNGEEIQIKSDKRNDSSWCTEQKPTDEDTLA